MFVCIYCVFKVAEALAILKKQEFRGAAYPHLAGWNLRSSSVSVSLWIVMMLTAGLGVSEMMIGWDNVALELGGVTPLLLSNDAVDIPLDREKEKKTTNFELWNLNQMWFQLW